MFFKFKCTSTFVTYIGVSAVSAGIAEEIVKRLFQSGEVDAEHIEDKVELVKVDDIPTLDDTDDEDEDEDDSDESWHKS